MSHRLENTKVPSVVFKTRVRDESVDGPNPFRWEDVSSEDFFANKKIVLFGLPGAFTPTCSSTHAPGYDSKMNDFRELGVNQIVCLSVNDAFVMYKWSQDLGTQNVFMLPDGNLDFTKGIGMNVQKQNLGFGERSWRYSMYIENGTIKKVFEEPGFADNAQDDPFEVSDADTMLAYLKENSIS